MIERFLNPLALALTLAVLGDVVVERSGVLNLAIDGLFVLCVAVTFSVFVATSSPIMALIAVLACGAVLAVVMSMLINVFLANHVLAGLAMNMVCYGIATIVGTRFLGRALPTSLYMDTVTIGVVVALSTALTWLLLYRTSFGVALRACGYNPRNAEALGIDVGRTRLVAMLLGYELIALGAFVYLASYVGTWSAGLGTGWGFLALSLAIASLWHPVLAPILATSFAALYVSMVEIQTHPIRIGSVVIKMSPAMVSAIPFVAALVLVSILYATPLRRIVSPPRALGEPYFREERTL